MTLTYPLAAVVVTGQYRGRISYDTPFVIASSEELTSACERGATIDLLMRDLPMLDSDRELMRDRIRGFDDMTIGELQIATRAYHDATLDFINELRASNPPEGS